MARTLDEIREARPSVDQALLKATGEADIRRHKIEDGEDPNAPKTGFILRRRPGQRGPGKKPAKEAVTLRIDPAVLAKYKATGAGWQTRMHEVIATAADTVAALAKPTGPGGPTKGAGRSRKAVA